MANKRGRPKKLAVLQEKDFSRQFQEACIPALLVDRELAVIYANPYALDTMPELEQPEGLERLLGRELLSDCRERLAGGKAFRVQMPGMGPVLAVTPLAGEETGQVAGAMVLATGGGRPG